jgi:lysozyme family protein
MFWRGGGLQYEANLMLKQFVYEDKYFSIADLTYRLEYYGFGYVDAKNRPTPIT